MATPNLALSHIQAAQNQKEVTANAAFDGLDTAMNGIVTMANADADLTLTVNQLASAMVLSFTGALTADRKINLPANIERLFVIDNDTTGAHNLIVQVTGGAGSSVSVGTADGLTLLYCDGTNVEKIGGGGTGGGTGTGDVSFADAITPVGTINGTNAIFTLPQSPTPGTSLWLVKNGRVMFPAIDYTLVANTITYASGSIPQSGPGTPDVHICWYRY